MTIDKVIEALEKADKASAAALSIADRILGAVGRRSVRWHDWRAYRLRLRATEIEAGRRRKLLDSRQRAAVVAGLRKRAAGHIERVHGVGRVDDLPPAQDMRALIDGREPLAGAA